MNQENQTPNPTPNAPVAKEAPLFKAGGVSVYLRTAGTSQYYSVGERGEWLRVPTKWMGHEISPEEAVSLYNGIEVSKTGQSGKEFYICGGATREGAYPSKLKPGETVKFQELVLSQVFPKREQASGELFGFSVAKHGKPGEDGKFPKTEYVDFYRFYGRKEKPIGELLPTDCARLLNGLAVYPNDGLKLTLGEIAPNKNGYPTAFVKFNFIRDGIEQDSEAVESAEAATHAVKR